MRLAHSPGSRGFLRTAEILTRANLMKHRSLYDGIPAGSIIFRNLIRVDYRATEAPRRSRLVRLAELNAPGARLAPAVALGEREGRGLRVPPHDPQEWNARKPPHSARRPDFGYCLNDELAQLVSSAS